MAKDCCFTTDIPAPSTLDPKKRVRYFTGQVLGEDEFRQDQLYLMTRDEQHQRGLHGYGRVSGLHVGQRMTDAGTVEIVVSPGLAVNPRGETICVHQAQCADLDIWLETNRDDLLGSPPLVLPGVATLYLVLCARDCETDLVPVLGDPCRVLDEATAASRIADDFNLCFRLDPPEHSEETAITELGALLRDIEITDALPGMSPETLAQLVRDTFLPVSSPPGPPPASPPAELTLHPDTALEAMEAALQVWVTEVRPTLNPETGACTIPRDGDGGRCVLIGCLDVPFGEGADGLEVTGPVTIDGTCGPLLLQTRLLQELALLPALGGAPGGGVLPPITSPPEGDSPPVPDGDATSPPSEAPALPLPQVAALSWVHDNASLLRLQHDGAPAFGLALGFGLSNGDAIQVEAATLTPRTVRVGLRIPEEVSPPGLPLETLRNIVPAEVIPVDFDARSGQIVETRSTPGPGAAGVFFRITSEAANALLDSAATLFVELVADHILDLEGRPIASNFPRAAPPTARAGHFESWVDVGRPRIVLAAVDINRDNAVAIRTLPGIGTGLAARIVTARERAGGFDVLDDLVGVRGITETFIDNNLRPLLEA